MASKQAEKIPQLVLEHIKQAAKKALITMPICEHTMSYVTIKHFCKSSKTFVDFIEWFQVAIEQWVEGRLVQSELLTAIAQASANKVCK